MKFDYSHIDFSKGPSQITKAFKILGSTPKFIYKHKLWTGFLDHKWIMVFSILIAGLFTLILYSDIYDSFVPNSAPSKQIEVPAEGLDEAEQTLNKVSADIPPEAGIDLENEKEKLAQVKEKLSEDHEPLFSGSLKFLLLILLEVLIFHFSVKTNNILKGESKVLKFKDFIKAQKRMMIVMARKWVYGLIMYILISIILAFYGWDALADPLMFFVYGFYMGFAFLDNYLEQFGFKIKQSIKCIQKHYGASVIFGVLASLLMSIPFIGPFITPLVFGIAATRYGHEYQIEHFKIEKTESPTVA